MKKNNTTEYRCGDRSSFDKAWKKGEQTFTLRAQDRTSTRCIAFWIMENIDSAPEEKLRHALEDALRTRKWRKRRWAD